jgi:hypothetical protein
VWCTHLVAILYLQHKYCIHDLRFDELLITA